MELTKEHRKALLVELDRAQEDLDTNQENLVNEENGELKLWYEISCWLALERISSINTALTENDIDY